MQLLDGKTIAAQMRAEVRAEVTHLREAGQRVPRLVIVLVGDEEVSKAMIDNDRRVKRYTGLRQLLENYEDH